MKKVLKWVGIVLLVIVLLYLVACLLGKSEISKISRSTVINAPASRIYPLVADFKAWDLWSPWHKQDPAMTKEYGTLSVGKGASYSWKSEKMGNGKMQIIEAEPDKYLKLELNFDGWNSSYSEFVFNETEPNRTEVTWTLENPNKIPFLLRGMMLMMNFEKLIGQDYESGLKNLTEAVAQSPK